MQAWTTLAVETPDSGAFRRRLPAVLDDAGVDRHSVLDGDRPGRLAVKTWGWDREAFAAALTDGTLAPVEWAVLTWTLDEGIGVEARVYDGHERVDEFSGFPRLGGRDTEAYLERLHDVRVPVAGSASRHVPYRPSVALAVADPPERSLAGTPPEPPFESADDPVWVLVEAAVDDPAAFLGRFRERLRADGVRFAAPADRLDRPWVEGPTDLRRESPADGDPGRVRVRVPLTAPLADEDGIRTAAPDWTGVSWLVVLLGDGDADRVDASVFLDAPRRLRWDRATDQMWGDAGRRGADVAAYLRRFYGWTVDPTPAGVETPARTDRLPTETGEPPPSAVDAVAESDLEPGPGMPSPGE